MSMGENGTKEVLFTSGNIGSLILKNRIVMTAVHLGYSFEREKAFFVRRAKGGAAAVTSVWGVTPVGTSENMHLICLENKEALASLAKEIQINGSKVIVQLFHAGRNGNMGRLYDKKLCPVSPSNVPSPIYKEIPKRMSIEEIRKTVLAFGKAAKLCKDSGVDAVEISCSAGYLLTQFLSPITNLRTDEYGGSEENRMRFPKEVISEVRSQVGNDYPVILRISGSDMTGGYSLGFMQNFCQSIPKGQLDGINVTGGWHEAAIPQITYHVKPGQYAFFAKAIRRVVDIPVIVCNRINNGETAEKLILEGFGDFVGCCRAFITDPDFSNKIRNDIHPIKCIGCNKLCIERTLKLMDVQCIFNPLAGKESEDEKEQTTRTKKIAVIGGGISGMWAAKMAAQKGHKVTLLEEKNQLGGKLLSAGAYLLKDTILKNKDTLISEIKELGIEVLLGNKVSKAFIDGIGADHIIIAVGGQEFIPPVEGIKSNENKYKVFSAEEILLGEQSLIDDIIKESIVIIGGGAVGIETALFLGEKGYPYQETLDFVENYLSDEMFINTISPFDITIVEATSKMGTDLGGTKWIAMKALKRLGIKTLLNSKVVRYDGQMLSIEKEGDIKKHAAVTVIMATGYKKSQDPIIDYCEAKKYPYTIIGDAKSPGNIGEATKAAKDCIDAL